MIKAAIFDMFETLVTLFEGRTYFSENIAEDVGVPLTEFRKAWHSNEHDRTIGKLTMKEGIARTLQLMDIHDEAMVEKIAQKRMDALGDTFRNIPEETLQLLKDLKKRGIKIGLISNCFSDEFEWIKNSPFYPLFDAPMLSYEQGLAKPDPEIFQRILRKLEVTPEECLYIGDGGSKELYAAREAGMKPLQALYFHHLAFEPHVPCEILPEFAPIWRPAEVLTYCEP
ncbi:MAG: HAD-IA family hydrolase [Lachnospiraceae bacterium]|nr:HAD-IA family hydrolase [Lachnospiraceae bacterium]